LLPIHAKVNEEFYQIYLALWKYRGNKILTSPKEINHIDEIINIAVASGSAFCQMNFLQPYVKLNG